MNSPVNRTKNAPAAGYYRTIFVRNQRPKNPHLLHIEKLNCNCRFGEDNENEKHENSIAGNGTNDDRFGSHNGFGSLLPLPSSSSPLLLVIITGCMLR